MDLGLGIRELRQLEWIGVLGLWPPWIKVALESAGLVKEEGPGGGMLEEDGVQCKVEMWGSWGSDTLKVGEDCR